MNKANGRPLIAPTDPFPPKSPLQLGVYRGNSSNGKGSLDAGLEMVGGIGAGPRANLNAYWIDAYSAWLGCANGGPGSCTLEINGYTNGEESASISQTVVQPPCPGLKNCSLAMVEFEPGFRSLTTLQIVARVGLTTVDWYMDDLSLGWSNTSCAAQIVRSSSE